MTPKVLAGAVLAVASVTAQAAQAAPVPTSALTTNTSSAAGLTVSPSAKAVILAQYTTSKKLAVSKKANPKGASFVDTNSGGFKDKPGFADFRKPTGDLKNKKINVQKNLKTVR
jgi:hypothetical protein